MTQFFSLDKASLADKAGNVSLYEHSAHEYSTSFNIEVGHGFVMEVSIFDTQRNPWDYCGDYGVIEEQGDESEGDQVFLIDDYKQYNITQSIFLAKEHGWLMRKPDMSDEDYAKAIEDYINSQARFVMSFIQERKILAGVSFTIVHPSLGVAYDDIEISLIVLDDNQEKEIVEAAENFITGANKWYDNEGNKLIAEAAKKRIDELADLIA